MNLAYDAAGNMISDGRVATVSVTFSNQKRVPPVPRSWGPGIP